ncbi:hypothetical protein [Streptomyces xanthophaeus]
MTTRTLLAAAVLAAGAALAAAPTAMAAPSDTPSASWDGYQEYSPLCTVRGIGCVNWNFAPMKAAEGTTNAFLPIQS